MIIPAGYGQANFVWSGAALPEGAETTMGFVNPGGVGDADQIANIFHGAYGQYIAASMTPQVSLIECRVKLGPNATGAQGSYSGVVVGTYGVDSLPANTSILVRKSTALGGRQGSGRHFTPGFREDRVSGSGLISAFDVTSLQGSFDAFQNDIEAAGLQLALLRAEGSPLQMPEVITSLVVQSRVATQRKRLRR